jgi:hypothetical protein
MPPSSGLKSTKVWHQHETDSRQSTWLMKIWDYIDTERNWEASLTVPIGSIRGPIGDVEVSVVYWRITLKYIFVNLHADRNYHITSRFLPKWNKTLQLQYLSMLGGNWSTRYVIIMEGHGTAKKTIATWWTIKISEHTLRIFTCSWWYRLVSQYHIYAFMNENRLKKR